jgi:hypothetical protein
MGQDDSKDKNSVNWRTFILWPFVILLFYVLSAGPVCRMQKNGLISMNNNFVKRVYYPIGWAYFRTFLHKPLGLYLHLWIPMDFDKNGNPSQKN